MKADLKAKWLEALRSGKYEQGRGALLDGGKYCCLGVLCEVAGLKITRFNHIEDDQYASTSYQKLSEILGVDTGFLTSRNDGETGYGGELIIEPHTFEALANYIEANIPADDHSVADVSA